MVKARKNYNKILREMKINDPYKNDFSYYNDIVSRHLRLAEYIKITHNKDNDKNPDK
ncbi:MAG: hypothetical protein GX756_00650 [Clostridiales bacterium]|nr:hypothetical protein [Clostridiales bacterium]